jgi:LmbE family N-acetylglucosaminyl deacetylase
MKILVVGPHPDDAEYGAGGLIAACNRSTGATADIACFAGAPETDAGETRSEWDRVRAQEAADAAALLGAELLTLPACGLADGPAAIHALVRVLRARRPDLVVTVPPEDSHPFHRSVSQWTQEAVFAATSATYAGKASGDPQPAPAQLWFMDSYSAPQPEPTYLVDVTRWFTTARRALLAHETGLRVTPGLDYQMRARHSQLGCLGSVPLAEGFTQAPGFGQAWVARRMPAFELLVDLHRLTGRERG